MSKQKLELTWIGKDKRPRQEPRIMGRRWIMIELGEHCHTHIIPRLKKVIDGDDPGGITQAVGWQGGGGFRYYRLRPASSSTIAGVTR